MKTKKRDQVNWMLVWTWLFLANDDIVQACWPPTPSPPTKSPSSIFTTRPHSRTTYSFDPANLTDYSIIGPNFLCANDADNLVNNEGNNQEKRYCYNDGKWLF